MRLLAAWPLQQMSGIWNSSCDNAHVAIFVPFLGGRIDGYSRMKTIICSLAVLARATLHDVTSIWTIKLDLVFECLSNAFS